MLATTALGFLLATGAFAAPADDGTKSPNLQARRFGELYTGVRAFNGKANRDKTECQGDPVGFLWNKDLDYWNNLIREQKVRPDTAVTYDTYAGFDTVEATGCQTTTGAKCYKMEGVHPVPLPSQPLCTVHFWRSANDCKGRPTESVRMFTTDWNDRSAAVVPVDNVNFESMLITCISTFPERFH